jgi:hypothetical protein
MLSNQVNRLVQDSGDIRYRALPPFQWYRLDVDLREDEFLRYARYLQSIRIEARGARLFVRNNRRKFDRASVMALVVRTGVDMVKIARIADVVGRHGSRFVVRILSADEIQICAGRISAIAARWAAKEAVRKNVGGRYSWFGEWY